MSKKRNEKSIEDFEEFYRKKQREQEALRKLLKALNKNIETERLIKKSRK